MSILRLPFEIRNKIRNRLYLNKVIRRIQAGTLFNMLTTEERDYWKPRIEDVKSAPDTEKIKVVKNAGTINADKNLVMHNGLIIHPLSYYGAPMLELLIQNKGIHEPQEEYVFQEVLRSIPDNATMIELGAFWSFYSMWFNKSVKNAMNFMIEPEGIHFGQNNFKLNNMSGDFTKAYVSTCNEDNANGVPTICIDKFCSDKNIDFVDILHSDIQGFELKMLEGAKLMIDKFKIGYLFISTHSNELHYKCDRFLKSSGYLRVCSIDLDESFSVDGLLVYRNPNYLGLESITVSKKSK